METKTQIIAWLRDAYAMEKAVETSLQRQLKSERVSPAVHEQAAIHLSQTQGHAEAVHACLVGLGSETSGLKTGLAWGVERIRGLGSLFARDDVVKDVLDSYAVEHFEIACYTALRTAAERAGMREVAATCDAILVEEKAMAEWLHQNLPNVVGAYLAASMGDASPKKKPARKPPARSTKQAGKKKKTSRKA